MHSTIVTLKDGTTYKGSMKVFRPVFNYFTLYGIGRMIYFDECESVITLNDGSDRISFDEMERAKEELDQGRKLGWKQDGKDYPLEKWHWEKKYE